MAILHSKKLPEYYNLHTTEFQGNMSDIKRGYRNLDCTKFINTDQLRKHTILRVAVLLFEADLSVKFILW